MLFKKMGISVNYDFSGMKTPFAFKSIANYLIIRHPCLNSKAAKAGIRNI
jgi:hypothetical protein